MAADLQTADSDRQLMRTEIPLGPPNRTAQRLIGAVIGIPVGLGIGLPPHGLLLGIGGVAFLTYLVGWTAVGIPRMRRFATENNLALGALGSWTYLAVHSIFDKLYVDNLFLHVGAILGLIGGLHLSSKRVNQTNDEHDQYVAI